MIQLTAHEVVTAFSQTLESDFAVGDTTGDVIIAQEIYIQRQKLLEMLHPEVIKLLQNQMIEEIVPIRLVSPHLYQILPTFVSTTNSIEYQLIKKNKKYFDCIDDACFSTSQQHWISLTSPYTINSIEELTVYDAEIRYSFDPAVALPSLKSWLRDMVCCNLGSRIFPAIRADEWSIVKHYCKNAEKREEKAGTLIPPELLRVNYAKPLFRTINFLRIARG